MSIHVRRLVAALLCTGVLAGCSDDSKAEPKDPESKATVSPSPTPTGVQIPAEAKGTDEASARAFVKFWFESINAAFLDGDVSSLKALATKACKSCLTYINGISDVYGKGGRFETDGYVAELVDPLENGTATSRHFLLRLRQEPRVLINEKGAPIDTKPQALYTMRVELVRQDGHWATDEMVIIQ